MLLQHRKTSHFRGTNLEVARGDAHSRAMEVTVAMKKSYWIAAALVCGAGFVKAQTSQAPKPTPAAEQHGVNASRKIVS